MLKLGHVALSVSDIDESIRFYRKIFGFRTAKKYLHKDIGLTIALLKKGDFSLELFEFKKHKALPAYRKGLDSDLRTLGTKHLSFAAKDIKREYARLKRLKLRFTTSLRTFDDGRRYFFIRDPDGILVEVMEA